MRATHVASVTLLCATLLLAGPAAYAGILPTWGVRASTPQIVSASGGLLIGEIDPAEPPADGTTHLPHGLLLQVEPGLGGGKLSVGYAKGLLPYAGFGLKLSALRTWGNPLWAEPHATYLGVEADASFFIKLSLGLMKRVGGNRESRDVLVTAGVGLAF
jgi:hypothetical protein